MEVSLCCCKCHFLSLVALSVFPLPVPLLNGFWKLLMQDSITVPRR